MSLSICWCDEITTWANNKRTCYSGKHRRCDFANGVLDSCRSRKESNENVSGRTGIGRRRNEGCIHRRRTGLFYGKGNWFFPHLRSIRRCMPYVQLENCNYRTERIKVRKWKRPLSSIFTYRCLLALTTRVRLHRTTSAAFVHVCSRCKHLICWKSRKAVSFTSCCIGSATKK